MVLSPAGVLTRGLHYLLIDSKRQSEANRIHTFQQHYGSSPLLLATVWHDMTVTTILEARIPDNELCERGFRMFLIAHFFLWTYPKNAGLLASRFKICCSHAQGEPLWTSIHIYDGVACFLVALLRLMYSAGSRERFVCVQ